MNRMSITTLVLGFLGATFLVPTAAEAIPAFARQYKISCTTCHEPFPRLKEFGEEFAANGFTIPEQEKDRDFVSAGDDLLRLNRDFPLAVRFDAFSLFESDSPVGSDLQSPWGLKLLSGGNLSRNVGYYFYFFMDERGEVAGVEDAYVHFNNIGGRPFDIMVGQFQTSDPLMKRELRLTYEDYHIYKTKVGDSHTDLTYDRGVMMTYDIEKTGTGLVALVCNGNGKPEAYQENGGAKKYDTDKYKNFAFRVAQDLGGNLGAGYYFYYGKEAGLETGGDGTFRDNEIVYHGPDLVLGNGVFDLTLQYLFRSDTNPSFVAAPRDVDTEGVVAELVISPRKDRSRYHFTLLYNQVDSDWNQHDYETMTVGATYLVSRNLRLTAEFTSDIQEETQRGVLGLVSAF